MKKTVPSGKKQGGPPPGPDLLREGLSQCVDALQRRQAHEISEALVDRLVALDWLEWSGGTLRLTTTGQNIHRRELAQSKASAAQGALDRQSPQSIRRT